MIDHILEEIKILPEDELLKLNSLIINKIKSIRAEKILMVKNNFNVNDIVYFYSNRHKKNIEGIITKINRKTADVKTEYNSWRVNMSMLKKVND